MERILLVYLLVLTIALAAVLNALRGDSFLSHKWARVRVRTGENRRKDFRERREEEFETNHSPELLILGAFLLFVYLLLSKW